MVKTEKMGILDIFKKKQNDGAISAVALPTKVDPASLTEEKRRNDLKILMDFETKIKNSQDALDQGQTDATSQKGDEPSEEIRAREALRLQNPFRGS